MLGGPGGVASVVRVVHESETCFGYGLYEVRSERVVHGTEYWTTAGAEAPPAWRQQWTE